MSWFDEQLRERKRRDDAAFETAFLRIAGAVTGRRQARSAAEGARDALGDILRYYRIEAAELPEQVTELDEQIDLLMRPRGIMHRQVTLAKGWSGDAYGPMLGRRRDSGALTSLLPGRAGGYTFFDETAGRRMRVTRRNEGSILPEAIAFYLPFPLKMLSFAELGKYILGLFSPADFLSIALATLAATLIGLLTPRINQLLFSDVLASNSVPVLLAASVFLICALLAGLLMTAVRTLLGMRINTKLEISVEAATMLRILSLPAGFFRHHASGDLSSRARQMSSLCTMLVNTVFTTGLTSLFSLIYVGQIFTFAPALAAPALLILLATVVISVVSSLWQTRISRRRMELAGRESGMSYALITGIRKIRLAGAEKRAFARWGGLYAALAELTYHPPAFLRLNGVLTTAVNLLGTAALYVAAVRSGISTADYMAFNSAFGMVSGAFYALAGIALTVSEIRPVLERCRPLLEAVPEISERKKPVTRLSGGIELSHVSFRYAETMPPVLDNLSLKIRPGQYVAIAGPSGCGKSTLLRLLLGFETPQKGAVYYDGRDLSTLELSSLRSKIGTVLQNGKLLQDSIYHNITLSAPWLTPAEAWESAELAGLAEDIREMPMGMSTMISEGSGGISGGQKQRLMIARAIAPKPSVLLLDEATSALDNLTQKRVSEALDGLRCTRIVVAHRLSTIRRCDRILVLDGGRIVEDGSYEDLIARKGVFAELVARQMEDDGPDSPCRAAGKRV